MGELRPWHIIILLAVIFVLFGYKKLPDATRSLGRSLRILKTEVKSLHEDDEKKDAAAKAEATGSAPASAPAVPRAVEAPRPTVPQSEAPAVTSPPVAAGAPSAPQSDSDRR